jgi:hypothetical protein
MRTLAETLYLDSRFGVETELPRAGTSLENPFVYDASAREMKGLAEKGLIEITQERTAPTAEEPLIRELRFKRLR